MFLKRSLPNNMRNQLLSIYSAGSRRKSMRHKLLYAFLAVFAVLVAPAASRADDAEELLKHVVANLRSQQTKRENYAFTEDYRNINYDKNGKIKVDNTAKFEIVFIEGTPYKRKTEE